LVLALKYSKIDTKLTPRSRKRPFTRADAEQNHSTEGVVKVQRLFRYEKTTEIVRCVSLKAVEDKDEVIGKCEQGGEGTEKTSGICEAAWRCYFNYSIMRDEHNYHHVSDNIRRTA